MVLSLRNLSSQNRVFLYEFQFTRWLNHVTKNLNHVILLLLNLKNLRFQITVLILHFDQTLGTFLQSNLQLCFVFQIPTI